jgi:hypothetical protein
METQKKHRIRFRLRAFIPAVLLFFLWLFSLGSIIVWHALDTASHRAAIGHGTIIFEWGTLGSTAGVGSPSWTIGGHGNTLIAPRHWYFTSWWDSDNLRLASFRIVIQPGHLELSLLYPFLIALVPPAIRLFRDLRRKPPGCCHNCGYDLSTLPNPTCPECGTTQLTLTVSP